MTSTAGTPKAETKAFKNWDKYFKPAQIKAKRQELGVDRYPAGHKVAAATKWEHGYHTYPKDLLKWAAYEARNTEDWQLFRVALKGLSTQQKIFLLDQRWWYTGAGSVTLDGSRTILESEVPLPVIEHIRIMNYIGALRRGGLLNLNNEIVR